MSGLKARTGLKVTGSILASLGLAAVMTVSVAAAPPNVNTGSGISVDGSFADWTEADFFADMYRAADDEKQVESKLYLRYDCSTSTLFVRVDAVDGVTIPTDNPDNNYVKFGNDDKKLDGHDAPPDGTQPELAYAGTDGWEASFLIAAPLSIDDLNVHAQVVSGGGSETSAVADRAIPMNITCTELTSTTAAAASVTPASCTAAGTLVVPADTDSVMYSVSPAYAAGATGDFTVTATAKSGFVLTGTAAWTLTVEPQITGAACITGGGTLPGNPTPPPVGEGTLGSTGGPAGGGLPNTAVPVELAASLGSLLVIASGIGFSLTRRRRTR